MTGRRRRRQESSASRGNDRGRKRETYSPVGCSYLPAAGVSRVTDTDMLVSEYELLVIILRSDVKVK